MKAITLLFVSANDSTEQVTFKIRDNSPLKITVNPLRERQVIMGRIGLTHNGNRLNLEQTPQQLGLKNEAIIKWIII